MNRLRVALSLLTAFALLAGTVHYASAWFPLTGTADQERNPTPDNPVLVSESDLQSRLIHRVPPFSPEEAGDAAGTESVILSVTVNEEGDVADVAFLSGPPLLADSAMEAVWQWKYSPILLNGIPIPVTSTVTLPTNFVLPVEIPRPPSDSNVKRIGGNVLQSKLIYKVDPEYPELAKRTRVQGSVILGVTVDEEGNVTNLTVYSGNPMLRDAAVEAVEQWKYEPMLLNGTPVPVIATVTVLFRLSRDESFDVQTGAITLNPGSQQQVFLYRSNDMEGVVEYRAGPVDRTLAPSVVYELPKLLLNSESLLAIAHEELLTGIDLRRSLVYLLVVDASGEIVKVRQLQGPEIRRIEDELYRTQVLQPGMYDHMPEAYECIIEIKLSE